MRRPGRRAVFAAGAAGLIGAACAFGPLAAAADTPPKTAADCRAISDFNLRGACWDTLDKQNQNPRFSLGFARPHPDCRSGGCGFESRRPRIETPFPQGERRFCLRPRAPQCVAAREARCRSSLA